MPITKSFEEIACGPDSSADDIQFFKRFDAGWSQEHTVASDIGLILASDYLPFLLAIRKIIEAHDPIEHRVRKLREMLARSEWQSFVERWSASRKSNGADWIVEQFFPQFINTIPGLTKSAVSELLRFGLDTPNKIAAAHDETLLSIKGIGHAKLQVIRDHCAGITERRDSDRVENVAR